MISYTLTNHKVVLSKQGHYQIMSVMSHTEARTLVVYTKGVERRGLAADGLKSLAVLDW